LDNAEDGTAIPVLSHSAMSYLEYAFLPPSQLMAAGFSLFIMKSLNRICTLISGHGVYAGNFYTSPEDGDGKRSPQNCWFLI
jgi:hypothetical protein